MELALYHPAWGYYTRRRADSDFLALGRPGDFYTSVSVGETFGFLLARAVVREWEGFFRRARPFVVVEQGGHDGRLARDILAGLGETGSPLAEAFEYRLVEPRVDLRTRLAGQFGGSGPVRICASLEEARAPEGIFLCNELLDAFPVDLLVFEGGEWRERKVGWDSAADRPAWVTRPLREEWSGFAGELGTAFPEGYTTEICPAVDAWMKDASRLFDRGLWWIVDYGQERADYYHPGRRSGTLRCFRGHRAGNDPFEAPGEQDLTADVDFTRVERAAARGGLSRRRFTDQHHFLIEAAKSWLLSLEGGTPGAREAKRLRQFQTLTHPGMMGQRFKVMELSRGG